MTAYETETFEITVRASKLRMLSIRQGIKTLVRTIRDLTDHSKLPGLREIKLKTHGPKNTRTI